MNIGFIGIGAMGRHMSRHVLEAGYSLYVYDLEREAAQEIVDSGAKWADIQRAWLSPVKSFYPHYLDLRRWKM